MTEMRRERSFGTRRSGSRFSTPTQLLVWPFIDDLAAAATVAPSFDDLIRPAEKQIRQAEAERLGGFQVNDQSKPRWLLYGKVRRFGTLQNFST